MNLKGLRVLNTRPVHQAAALNAAIEQIHGIAISCPALEIQASNHRWLEQIPPLSTIHYCIFISANAVQYFFLNIKKQKNWPMHIPLICVGRGTALALPHEIKNPVILPEYPDGKHLLQLEALQKIEHQNILYIAGERGRKNIPDTLHARGAHVISLAVYRRTLPKINSQLLETLWQEDKVDIILFTSAEAIKQLFTLFGKDAHTWLCSKPCIVISARLYTVAKAIGMQQVIQSSYEDILDSLAHYAKTIKTKDVS